MHAAIDHGSPQNATPPTGFLAPWFRIPLFVRIAIGLGCGLVLGLILRNFFWNESDNPKWLLNLCATLNQTSRLIMRALGAIAPPLIMMAVIRSLMGTHIQGKAAARLTYLLLLNTFVAIFVGLLIANTIRPGTHVKPVKDDTTVAVTAKHPDPLGDFLDSVPDSLVKPLVENNSIGVIILAISFGMAARKLPDRARESTFDFISTCFSLVVIVLYWVLELVPLAVFCRVAFLLTTGGIEPFKSLAWFVFAVIGALLLQSGYYLLRVWWRSWVTPVLLLRGTRDALVMAFSTGSSVATMPLTYECLTKRVGLKADSTSLGVLVGGNFNHDGTALYEAMSALFVSQALGVHLNLGQQLTVVITSMIAAVGAAGIPEAGLVTMTLVFSAVRLPVAQIAMVLPVDWFLDRCRTAINVMGDTSVACLLDGIRQTKPPVEDEVALQVAES